MCNTLVEHFVLAIIIIFIQNSIEWIFFPRIQWCSPLVLKSSFVRSELTVLLCRPFWINWAAPRSVPNEVVVVVVFPRNVVRMRSPRPHPIPGDGTPEGRWTARTTHCDGDTRSSFHEPKKHSLTNCFFSIYSACGQEPLPINYNWLAILTKIMMIMIIRWKCTRRYVDTFFCRKIQTIRNKSWKLFGCMINDLIVAFSEPLVFK